MLLVFDSKTRIDIVADWLIVIMRPSASTLTSSIFSILVDDPSCRITMSSQHRHLGQVLARPRTQHAPQIPPGLGPARPRLRSLTKRAITPTRSTYTIGRWQKRSNTMNDRPGIAIVRDDYADYHHVSPVRPVTYGRRRRGRCRGRYVLLPPPRPRTKRRGRHHQEDTGYASAPMSLRSMMGLVPTPRPNGMVGTTKR